MAQISRFKCFMENISFSVFLLKHDGKFKSRHQEGGKETTFGTLDKRIQETSISSNNMKF
jgi:hypothetical protein